MRNFKHNIHHSVAYWPLKEQGIKLIPLLESLKENGIFAIELVGQDNWNILEDYGFTCSMCKYDNVDYTKGWNDPSNHSELIDIYMPFIEKMAKYKFKNTVCFSGSRGTISDELGLLNCVEGLKKILPFAEKNGVVLHLEMLSQHIRPGTMGDNTDWGVRLCKAINSDNFKLLYDVYHMQLMEGNIINTIQKYHPYIGHYHVAGVPDRADIGSNQEINYSAIMNAIYKTGFKGFVAQEHFTNYTDKINGILDAIEICDI